MKKKEPNRYIELLLHNFGKLNKDPTGAKCKNKSKNKSRTEK